MRCQPKWRSESHACYASKTIYLISGRLTLLDGTLHVEDDEEEEVEQVDLFEDVEGGVDYGGGEAKDGEGGRHWRVYAEDGVVDSIGRCVLAVRKKQRLMKNSEMKQARMMSIGVERYSLYLQSEKMSTTCSMRIIGDPMRKE